MKWAWYHVPVLSDSPSAEFIRFRKYVSGVEYDENGNKLTYDDIILDKLTDLVNQEYDRIMLVRARDEEFQNNNPNISPIANYDISRKKDGSIKSIGGAEFKFLPALNSIRYNNGETFLDRLSRLSREGSGAELKEFIRDTLREVMDNGFERHIETGQELVYLMSYQMESISTYLLQVNHSRTQELQSLLSKLKKSLVLLYGLLIWSCY